MFAKIISFFKGNTLVHSKAHPIQIPKDQLKSIKEAILLDGMEGKSNIEQIKLIANYYNWKEIVPQPNPHLISFKKSGMRINVYHTTMTVGTCLKHPTKGRTQLFRKNTSIKELLQIFQKPRLHTGKGYYTKK